MYKKSLPGFTLIEMSFVLIIAGIIMGLTLPLLTTLLQQQKQRQTQTHQEHVLYAIAAYLNQHGHLPAPANAEATASEQGIATISTCQTGDYCQGLIPYRTLGLMENLAKDGYHQWMTYVTSKPLVLTNRIQDVGAASHERNIAVVGKQAFCEVRPGSSSLKLLDAEKQPLLNDETKDLWALILISHGFQGSNSDKQNTYKGPVYTIGSNGDLIKAVTRNNILAIYAHHPCQPQPATISLSQAAHSSPAPTQPMSYIPEPDPDDWQRPLPRQPLTERALND